MGMLLVDKPAGWTSHDVVALARSVLGTRKIGHAGTLDPFATGLLVLGTGRATRVLEYLVGLDKEYDATARLGVATDSFDPDGIRISEDDRWRSVASEDVHTVAAGLVGPLQQTPPRFSAVKVGGIPAHRRARRGEDVQLPERAVTVHSLEVVEMDLPTVRFRVRCSSGTYVRSLAGELGERLGTACHLTELRRHRVGELDVCRAATIPALREGRLPDRAWMSPASALSHLQRVQVDADEAAMLAAGRPVQARARDAVTAAFVLGGDGEELVAVGEVQSGLLKPRKVFLHV